MKMFHNHLNFTDEFIVKRSSYNNTLSDITPPSPPLNLRGGEGGVKRVDYKNDTSMTYAGLKIIKR